MPGTTQVQRARTMAELAPEDRLIVLACMPGGDECRDAAIAQTLRQPLDWRYIVRASIEHSVAPLLYHRLTAGDDYREAIPAAVLEDLSALYECSKARNQRLFRVTAALFEHFAKNKIEAIALKDLSLAQEVFAEPALRPMGDLDVLIHREQYEATGKCLREIGFAPVGGGDNPLLLKYTWGHHFRRPQDNIWLDLQWNILQRGWGGRSDGGEFDIARMWAAASAVRIEGVDVLRPCLEHMLFHLCLHLEGHLYSELILFVEIAELLRANSGRIDWEAFLAVVRDCRAERSVCQVLFFIERLLQAAVPDSVLARLQSPAPPAAALDPLLAPLSRLHFQMGEASTVAGVPDEMTARMEHTARRQALATGIVCRELECLQRGFHERTGGELMFICHPSERVFADQSLNAFGQVDILVRDRDFSVLRRALEAAGYQAGSHSDWEKRLMVCGEPLLPPSGVELDYRVDIEKEPARILSQTAAAIPTIKASAMKVLRAARRADGQAIERMPVRFRLIPLANEQILAYLVGELGRDEQNRFFHFATVLDFVENCASPFDWQSVLACVGEHGRQDDVQRGLRLLAAVSGEVGDHLPWVVPEAPATRLLVPPRPDLLGTRYAGFKPAFYCAWTMLTLRGARVRLRYLANIAVGRPGQRPLLGRIIGQACKALFRAGAPSRPDQPFACWIDPGLRLHTTRPQE